MTPYVTLAIRNVAPVPWSAPHVGRSQVRERTTRKGAAGTMYRTSHSKARLVAWEALVRRGMQTVMNGRPPLAGAVRLDITFYKECPPGKVPGSPWIDGINVPDLSNLFKAGEDGVKTAAFLDDCQVCESRAQKLYWYFDGITVEVYDLSLPSN